VATSRSPGSPRSATRVTSGPPSRPTPEKTFGPPVRIDEVGAVGRVDVELLADGSAVVTWIEFADERSEFRIRRAERIGSRSASLAVSGIASGDRVVIRDWRDGGTNCCLRGSRAENSLRVERPSRSSRQWQARANNASREGQTYAARVNPGLILG